MKDSADLLSLLKAGDQCLLTEIDKSHITDSKRDQKGSSLPINSSNVQQSLKQIVDSSTQNQDGRRVKRYF